MSADGTVNRGPLGLPYGIHRNVPADRYHVPELGVVSKSALDQVHRSPKHYRAWLDGVQDDTPALRFGQAFHCALLEPERFSTDYVVPPTFGDLRSSKNRAKRDEWAEANTGVTMITAADDDAIRRMVEAVRSHPLAGRMVVDGDPELTLTWKDDETGLGCRSRADYYVKQHSMVVDVKTTQDASAKAFQRSIANFRYHVQDALYRAAFAACGEPVEHFVLIAVEKTPPYGVALYSLDSEAIGQGHTEARLDMQRLADCLRDDEWPGYLEHIKTLELPRWALMEA